MTLGNGTVPHIVRIMPHKTGKSNISHFIFVDVFRKRRYFRYNPHNRNGLQRHVAKTDDFGVGRDFRLTQYHQAR